MKKDSIDHKYQYETLFQLPESFYLDPSIGYELFEREPKLHCDTLS